VLGGRRFGIEVERVAFDLVANEALAPACELEVLHLARRS
jgi:hypothetical protein